MLPTVISTELLKKFIELEKLDASKHNMDLTDFIDDSVNDSIDDSVDDSDAADGSDDEFILPSVSEYQFDVFEIKNPTDNHCLKCQKKFTNSHGLAICRSCMSELTINKTTAMKTYGLKNDELEHIEHYENKNGYRGYTHLYLTKEIRLVAIMKRFGLANPSLNEYTNCVQTLLVEAKERKQKSVERGQKMKETRKRNIELKIQNEKLAHDKRKSKLKKALSKKKIILDKTCDACGEYLRGDRTDLECVVELASCYHKRKTKLETALAKKNLDIRDDSYYCKKYLSGEKFTLKEVVDMMEIMDFFVNKTDYFKLTQSHLQSQYDDAKAYGYWDGDRITLCEDEKESIKKLALKKYLEKHSKKNIPQSVLDRYDTCNKKIYHKKLT
jgi:hypothetical protein